MPTQSHEFVNQIKATTEQVFHAFTNATALREWFCDISTVDPKPGGRFFVAWYSGNYACGEYLHLEQDRIITFSWFGRNEPSVSKVEVSLEKKNGLTQVHLVHILPDTSEEWTTVIEELKNGWETSLENLTSVLETGVDLRVTQRPMLGITLSDFNSEIADRLGVPVSEGIRTDGVLKGFGAEIAGLQSNDVIIEVDGKRTTNFGDIPSIMQGKRAGDTLLVAFYRGNEKKNVEMTLSGRKIPVIPETLEGLSEAVQKIYSRVKTEIEVLFKDVNESEASSKPKPNEWSAKEVLAHMIHSERFLQTFITDLIGGEERRTDRFAGNLAPPILATLTAFPTLSELLRELTYSFAETLALYENLPPGFINQKGSYWRLAFGTMEGSYHFDTHIQQIKESLNTAGEMLEVS